MDKKMLNQSILERIGLQQICYFILYGENSLSKDGTYNERILDAEKLAIDSLECFRDGKKGYLETQNDLTEAFSLSEEIYTERGMKLGAKLMLQLLYEEDR